MGSSTISLADLRVTVVNASRLSTFARNAAGVRGPFALDIGGNLVPIIDANPDDPLFDDELLYWGLHHFEAAAAALFSTAYIACAAIGVRAIIDRIFLVNGSAAQRTYQLDPGTNAPGSAAIIRNVFGRRTPAASSSGIVGITGATEAAINPGTLGSFIVAPHTTMEIRLGFVLDPVVTALVIKNNTANDDLDITVFGRAAAGFPY